MTSERRCFEQPQRCSWTFLSYITVIALLFTFAACAHRKRLLYEPESIQVWGKQSASEVERKVRKALHSRGWIVENRSPGSMTAKIRRGDHSATIRVNYSPTNATIKYLSSEKLFYWVDEDGQTRIHSRYNTWVQNAESALRAALS